MRQYIAIPFTTLAHFASTQSSSSAAVERLCSSSMLDYYRLLNVSRCVRVHELVLSLGDVCVGLS